MRFEHLLVGLDPCFQKSVSFDGFSRISFWIDAINNEHMLFSFPFDLLQEMSSVSIKSFVGEIDHHKTIFDVDLPSLRIAGSSIDSFFNLTSLVTVQIEIGIGPFHLSIKMITL